MDRAALAAYCQCYARWRRAETELNKLEKSSKSIHGALVSVTSNGNLIQNPLVGIANTAMKDMIKYAAEFGMTPSARTRIEASPLVDDEEEQSDFYG